MEQFKNHFFNVKLQPQIFSMILVTLILILLSIVIYLKVKKQQVDQAPKGILQVVEQYVMGVDDLFKKVSNDQIPKPAPYIFTLLTFLIFGNLITLIGVESMTSSYSVTLTLALISWIGIYVVGIVHKRMRFFIRYINPVETITQFAPLISISFRLFGNIFGGSLIIYLLYFVSGVAWAQIPFIGQSQVNILGSFIVPAFSFYFDIFNGLIQAYVFTLLTMLYWSLEVANIEQKATISEKSTTQEKGEAVIWKKV